MSAADTIRDGLAPIASAAQIAAAFDALDELEAELAREKEMRKLGLEREAAQRAMRGELEAELERLTVGRATLEDQTNRAELAEARVDALEDALREILSYRWDVGDQPYYSRACKVARAALVLSGGSE